MFAHGCTSSPNERAKATRYRPYSHLEYNRNDHRPAPVVVVHPSAEGPASELAELVRLDDSIRCRGGQSVLDQGPNLAEPALVDARAAGVNLGACDQLAVGGVHHHDDRDKALLAQDQAVLQR